ncbi:MAG: hypothetical protein ACQESN_00425 [Thermotogota bacterium]
MKKILLFLSILILAVFGISATIILDNGMFFIGEIEEETDENVVIIKDGFRYQFSKDNIFKISEEDLTEEEVNNLLNPPEPKEVEKDKPETKTKIEPQPIPQEVIDRYKKREWERRTNAFAVDPVAFLLNKHVKIDLLTFFSRQNNGGWINEFEAYDDELNSYHVKHAFYRVGIFYSFENIFEGIIIKTLVGMGGVNVVALDEERTSIDPDSQHIVFSLKPGVSYSYLLNNRFLLNGGLEYHLNWVAEPTAVIPKTITGLKLDVNIGVAF